MKPCCAFLAICLTLTVHGTASAQANSIVSGKTILHTDGTRTESVSDPNTGELEQKTFDANGVLILRRLYRLNERSLPVMGNIYDGAGNLVARAQTYFDSFGRMKEERLSNLQGEVFQQIVHEYDSKGTAKTPKVINYRVNSPTMRPSMLDFTKFQQPENEPAETTSSGRVKAPVDLEKTQPKPAATTPTNPPPAEEPKKGFLQRLFKKKESQ
jgi:hypothetical protein